MTLHLNVKGLHCASCKSLIEEVVPEVPGVTSCVVDLAAGTADVEGDGADPQAVLKAIEDLGAYEPSLV